MSEGISQGYDGPERRSIPIHVLEHIDQRLQEHVEAVQKTVSGHIEDEMDRYQEILRRQEETDKRLDQLMTSLTEYMHRSGEFHKDVRMAFPKDDMGDPDFKGHARDHKYRIDNAERDERLMAFVQKQMDEDAESRKDRRNLRNGLIGTMLAVFVLWAAKSLWFDAVSLTPVVPHQVEGKK